MNKLKSFFPGLAILAFFFYLYLPTLLHGFLPIPADTIVGLYHPFRDFCATQFRSGAPFKNFLITDPVRQQYVWRKLAMEDFKSGTWPNWNPYALSGTPLLA